MAAVAAVLGLVAGIVLGLSSPTPAPQAEASPPTETTVGPTTTTLPDDFHTVILGSYDERDNADRRLQQVRDQGARDAALLDQEQWEINTGWAVYSGQFGSREEAEAHRQELAGLGITPSFWKHVTRRD
jgi:cell division protein FtsN